MMTDHDNNAHIDGIVRAVFDEQLRQMPSATFQGDELERKGLFALYENEILCVLVKFMERRKIVFRGTLSEAMEWVAAQPDAEPSTTDPLRATSDSMLSAIAAGAAGDVRKRQG